MIEEIKAWKTSNGEVFADKKKAEAEERKIDFIDWYNSHPIDNTSLFSTNLFYWLDAYKNDIDDLINEDSVGDKYLWINIYRDVSRTNEYTAGCHESPGLANNYASRNSSFIKTISVKV